MDGRHFSSIIAVLHAKLDAAATAGKRSLLMGANVDILLYIVVDAQVGTTSAAKSQQHRCPETRANRVDHSSDPG